MSALKCVRLDLIVVRQYSKEFIFALVIMPALYFLSNQQFALVLSLLFIEMLLFWSYLFMAAEKCETLYFSLPQKKSDIVKARYLFGAVATAICLIMGVLMTLCSQPSDKRSEFIFIICFLSFFVLFMISVQAPVLFRFGYAKVRNLMILSVVIPIIVFAIISKGSIRQLMEFSDGSPKYISYPILWALCLMAGVLCLIVSYFISKRIYVNRDMSQLKPSKNQLA